MTIFSGSDTAGSSNSTLLGCPFYCSLFKIYVEIKKNPLLQVYGCCFTSQFLPYNIATQELCSWISLILKNMFETRRLLHRMANKHNVPTFGLVLLPITSITPRFISSLDNIPKVLISVGQIRIFMDAYKLKSLQPQSVKFPILVSGLMIPTCLTLRKIRSF